MNASLRGIPIGGAGRGTLPPWLFPREDARMVDYTADPVACGPDGASVTVIDFLVPQARILRVSRLGIDCADRSDLAFTEWRVKVSGELLEGYHFIPAGIGGLADAAEVVMVIDGGKRFQVIATNNMVQLETVYISRFTGWLYDPNAAVG